MQLIKAKNILRSILSGSKVVLSCCLIFASLLEAANGQLLKDDIVVSSIQLESVALADERGDDTPEPSPGDPNLPAIGLRQTLTELEQILTTTERPAVKPLREATELAKTAWHIYSSGSKDLSHLSRSANALSKAQLSLEIAAKRSNDSTLFTKIDKLQRQISLLVKRMASDALNMAEKAGVSPSRLAPAKFMFTNGENFFRSNEYTEATKNFGRALRLAAKTVTFDVALFEQNIKSALANKTVGYAFSIAYKGQLYQGGESFGFARTFADAPQTAQSPSKEMHVASVSKTLTAIVTLHLLEEKGLTPDTLIAPYLPSDWEIGNGVENLTFRDFMTHRSGFGQINAGSDYESLRTAIATDVVSQSFKYKNANFGLLRVLVSGLQGIDPPDFDEFEPAALTTATFLVYAKSLYDSIGVGIDCAPNDNEPTVQYKFPDDGTSGYVEPNRQLQCGGFGWFISSNELAAVMTNLRNTAKLLSAPARTKMQEGFLGYMDPANYSFVGGNFGTYYMHGGDWFHSSGQLHSCVAAFPIKVEVGLVINSAREATLPYQCLVLQSAFDNAWIAK